MNTNEQSDDPHESREGCPCGECTQPFRETYTSGRRYGYPACCCVRFGLQRPTGAHDRGLRFTRDGASFVPCGIFHRKHVTLEGRDRIDGDSKRELLQLVRANGFEELADLLTALAASAGMEA